MRMFKFRLINRMMIVAIVITALVLGYYYLKIKQEKEVLQETLAKINRNLARINVEQGDYQVLGERLEQVVKVKEELGLELEELRTNLGQTEEALDRSRVEIAVLAEKVKLLEKGKFSLEEKISFLSRDKELLQIELSLVTEDKEELEAKFSSLGELKKAIRKIKIDAQQRRINELREADAKKLLKGNRGYLIINGKSTMGPKVEIKVLPADF